MIDGVKLRHHYADARTYRDWKDISPYEMRVDREGNELKFKHSVSFAWDGAGKLFIKGTLNVPDNWLAKNGPDGAEWWTDDGRTSGGFWAPDNYLKLNFQP